MITDEQIDALKDLFSKVSEMITKAFEYVKSLCERYIAAVQKNKDNAKTGWSDIRVVKNKIKPMYVMKEIEITARSNL